MSDRRAIHDTVAAIKAGMNVELDWAPQYYTARENSRMHLTQVR